MDAPRPGATEEDYLVLTDFVNTTGEVIFDGTLTQAVAVKLEESPYLNVYPDEQVRETVAFMEREPDERITRDIGREICQRRALKAIMTGEIAALGGTYAITLAALDCQSGESLAREQVEARGREEVLTALGTGMTRMRRELGESLASIEKYDAPLEQATTKSLEALKAFAVGVETRATQGDAASVPHFERALELDPDFAVAHARLATAMANFFADPDEIVAHRRKAFELRDRVSEPERLYVTAHYYSGIERDIDKTIGTYEMWARTYPRDWTPWNNLADGYAGVGEYEKALEASRRAMELQPSHVLPRANLASAFLALGRFEEARAVLETAIESGLDTHQFHWMLYTVGHVTGDRELMDAQGEWHRGRATEPTHIVGDAMRLSRAGRWSEARERIEEAIALGDSLGNPSVRGFGSYLMARTAADIGFVDEARRRHLANVADFPSPPPLALGDRARLFADIGLTERAAEVLEHALEALPNDTRLHGHDAPRIRAAIAMAEGCPEEAVPELARARFELAGVDLPYERGVALLAAGRPEEAIVELRKVLDWPGIDPSSVRRALTRLQIARAYLAAGDVEAARDTYLDFFEYWAEADDDIPVLVKARSEFKALPGARG